MQFPNKYNCLSKNEFADGDYKIIPIRYEDRSDILKWRNEQIYHLRQDKVLTKESQDNYFRETVASIFEQQKPNQILFSYLKNDKCIGYGGLVRINWIDKNAEISFLINYDLEKKQFHFHWSNYLKMIESLAFDELNFHKIYVYAFDLRPQLYEVLLDSGYFSDAILKEHCYFNGCYLDVVIHSKLNK
jgi:RimJ/RimL family protein N-acetyltransferase